MNDPISIGDKVYVDSFAGIIKGKIVGLHEHGDCVDVKITSQNSAYRTGEIIVCQTRHVYNRNNWSIRGTTNLLLVRKNNA